jgi:hypothetical protein
MVVCAHGNVSQFCEEHGMKILESYEGDLSDYKGNCAVVVTDQEMTRKDYDDRKCLLFSRGVELVSTEWTDDDVILRLLHSQVENRKRRGGRQMYGFRKENGKIVEIPEKITVAKTIICMRNTGKTLREIRERVGLSVTTIQTILNNRGVYDKC